MTDVIRLDNLGVRYGNHAALDGVTADIPFGTSVAIIGPNGSGKSTLLEVLAGTLRPTAGTADLAGRRASIVLQSTDVDPSVPLTVRDTVTMARFPEIGLLRRLRPEDRAAINAAVDDLELSDLVDRQIHQLSGGQRQRAFVAQGLAQNAEVLLLDEPFTGLDVVSKSLVTTVLGRARDAGRTTLVATHSFAEAEECDLVMLLSTRCIAFGPPEDVLDESNLRQAFGGRFVTVGNTLVVDDPHHV